MPRKKKSLAAAGPMHALPPGWPQYTTPEFYSWMMERAIPADWSKHHPHNSYSPIFWYEDQQLQCRLCGCSFVFSKEEQRLWYEELKLPIQARAVHCVNCRAKLRAEKQAERLVQQKHMEQAAKRVPHPNEAFFKKRAQRGA